MLICAKICTLSSTPPPQSAVSFPPKSSGSSRTSSVSLSIQPRNYEEERTPMRKAVERWLAAHPYWLTHAFPSGPAARTVLGQPYRDMKECVRSQLLDENGELKYPNETAAYKRRPRFATINARIPFGIIRPSTCSVTGHKRARGDPSCCSWEGTKDDFGQNPIMLQRQRAGVDRWKQSDLGQLVGQMYSEERRAALRDIKKEIDLGTTIQSLEALSAREVAQKAMNTPQSRMNSITVSP